MREAILSNLTYGQMLRIARIKKDMSQTELADAAGVCKFTVVKAERSEPCIKVSTVQLLAHALDVDPMEIIKKMDVRKTENLDIDWEEIE